MPLKTAFDPADDLFVAQFARPANLEEVNLRALSPFQRVLLVIDGTVTKFIEAYTMEPVDVVHLGDAAQTLAQDHRWLGAAAGTPVTARHVLLRGRYGGTCYAYAASLIVPDRLSPELRAALGEDGGGLGRALADCARQGGCMLEVLVDESYATARPRSLDPFIQSLGREALGQIQLKRLQLMVEAVLQSNPFYRRKLAASGLRHAADLQTTDDYRQLPFTTKSELSADQIQTPPYGSNLTYPVEHYTLIHQTSGTKGEPLRWLDTDASWDWWARCWASVYAAAGVTPSDRIFFAFSFGPFIGFWSAYEGARKIGAMAIPGGGMSSHQRAKAILVHDVNVVVCTPTYALHLAEVAEQDGLDLAGSSVRTTIHAGEPGASVPTTKRRIADAWGACCYDHAGATEVGAWGFECEAQAGVHVNEGEFICEVVDPDTLEPAEEGELAITNLGRVGTPVIRYRTGDRVTLDRSPCTCGRSYVRLKGGVIGRVDDVLLVRGVNVYPSTIENIVRRFPEVGEFAVDVYREGELDQMEIRVELAKAGVDAEAVAGNIEKDVRNGLGLRVTVTPTSHGTLPRFDLKARRFTDHRE